MQSGDRLQRDALRALGEGLESLHCDAYNILSVQARLRSDSAAVRAFFAHAYRWFPPSAGHPDLDLAAIFDPRTAGRPFALAGDSSIDLSTSASPENRAFLFLLEALMDRIDSCIVLHGAALSWAGWGVILAGPAMAGKSTLTLEMMKLGHAFLSDDAAPLQRAGGLLLPFPRAVGVRKGPAPGGVTPELLPAASVLELPHKWLVDPAALGARLPAEACRPGFLFYLEPAAPRPATDRTFEIALAGEVAGLADGLRRLGALSIERAQGRPFLTLFVRFLAGSRPVSGLTSLWRLHRDSVLYMEESRPPSERTEGPAVIRQVGAAFLLTHLVRDAMNRGEAGRLMAAHGGSLTSLIVELGGLLRNVACHRVAPGSPALTASAIDRVVRGKEQAA